MTAQQIQVELSELADKEIATVSQRFFKTGPGEYGEGDVFRGIRVPVLRQLVRKYRHIELSEAERLLQSPFHEDRLLALFLMVYLFSKGGKSARINIYQVYLKNTQFINNWDLVDSSAEHIVGAFLWEKEREELYKLAQSSSIWERRIAIMATFHYIKKNEFDETLRIIRKLLYDQHDLIHKAAGWMLREIGKRNQDKAEEFLNEHYKQMPRTMLRYAIEKLEKEKRQHYLNRG